MTDQERAGVTADQTMRVAGALVLARYWAEAEAHEEAVLDGDDPEAVHDMRVAVRRLRAACALFAPWYRKRDVRPLKRSLRHLGDALGAVRDLEVLLGNTRAMARERGLDEPEAILEHWEREHASARAALAGHLESRKYRQLKRRLQDFVREQEERGSFVAAPDDRAGDAVAAADARPQRVADILPAEAWRRYGAVRAYEPLLADAGVRRLHRLRIAGKRLRYLLESFEGLWPNPTAEVVDLLKQMQDSLGAVHDAGVAIDLLQAFEAANPSSGDPTADLIEYQRGLLLHARAQFEELWPAIVSKRLRKRLGAAVAAL